MSERPIHHAVALRDRATGRYLGVGAVWSDDAGAALVLDDVRAAGLVRRFLCEPGAVDLVGADTLDRAVA